MYSLWYKKRSPEREKDSKSDEDTQVSIIQRKWNQNEENNNDQVTIIVDNYEFECL
jgi:hypothetical protein